MFDVFIGVFLALLLWTALAVLVAKLIVSRLPEPETGLQLYDSQGKLFDVDPQTAQRMYQVVATEESAPQLTTTTVDDFKELEK